MLGQVETATSIAQLIAQERDEVESELDAVGGELIHAAERIRDLEGELAEQRSARVAAQDAAQRVKDRVWEEKKALVEGHAAERLKAETKDRILTEDLNTLEDEADYLR